jgi:hypothetical protein
MATSLSALTNLEHLAIDFQSPTPHPRQRDRPQPPPTCVVLPALTKLYFCGVSEWLEVLAARIDAPLLNDIDITFYNQLVLDIPQVAQLIGRIELSRSSTLSLSFDPSREAQLSYCLDDEASSSLKWGILCNGLDWQVHAVAQLLVLFRPGSA